jgi:hypothetical protein
MGLQLFPRPLAGVWTDRTDTDVSVEGVAVIGIDMDAGQYMAIARDGRQYSPGFHQVEIVDDQVLIAANRGDEFARRLGRKPEGTT